MVTHLLACAGLPRRRRRAARRARPPGPQRAAAPRRRRRSPNVSSRSPATRSARPWTKAFDGSRAALAALGPAPRPRPGACSAPSPSARSLTARRPDRAGSPRPAAQPGRRRRPRRRGAGRVRRRRGRAVRDRRVAQRPDAARLAARGDAGRVRASTARRPAPVAPTTTRPAAVGLLDRALAAGRTTTVDGRPGGAGPRRTTGWSPPASRIDTRSPPGDARQRLRPRRRRCWPARSRRTRCAAATVPLAGRPDRARVRADRSSPASGRRPCRRPSSRPATSTARGQAVVGGRRHRRAAVAGELRRRRRSARRPASPRSTSCRTPPSRCRGPATRLATSVAERRRRPAQQLGLVLRRRDGRARPARGQHRHPDRPALDARRLRRRGQHGRACSSGTAGSAAHPAGATLGRRGSGAWRHDGAVRWATWQSGDTVYTVTTDGPASLLRRAVAAFPHAGPVETTTLGRVREGWSRILADLKG